MVVDSVFMGDDRQLAKDIANRQGAQFRPIYTYISDEKVWQRRIRQRLEIVPEEIRDKVATWESIQEQRKYFWAWKPESALFIDGIKTVEDNLTQVLEFITLTDVELGPL